MPLITDRTPADVAYYRKQSTKIIRNGWASLTAAEQAEWLASNLKGGYWYTDLNRVGTALEALQALLTGYGYSVAVNVRTDWAVGEWPTLTTMDAYIASIANIRSALAVLPTTPAAPSSMDGLTWARANDIEQILQDVEKLISNMVAGFRHCGAAVAGMGGLRL